MESDFATIRARVERIDQEGIQVLEDGSRYHGFRDPDAARALDYHIVDTIERLERIPRWEPEAVTSQPDYRSILKTMPVSATKWSPASRRARPTLHSLGSYNRKGLRAMKNGTGTVGCGCGVFVFCLFMGVTGISLGFGALYPPINGIAQPLVCSGGTMRYQQAVTHPLPGRTYVSASWTCVDPWGRATAIDSFPLSLYAGIFYGVLLFALLAAIRLLARLRKGGGASGRSPQP